MSGDAYETGLALLMLLVFALVASGYVLKEGLRKDEKTTHEILLRCVIIITSVVPRQLPMQMAMAVNMALMAMMKTGIFCTEPFRVPIAGKVSHCLFDKTGTLTTDQLVPVGVVPVGSDAFKAADEVSVLHDPNAAEVSPLCALDGDNGVATAVLAACHSVVGGQDGKEELAGDPIEVAALKGISWHYDPETDTATPGDDRALQSQVCPHTCTYMHTRAHTCTWPPLVPLVVTPGPNSNSPLHAHPSWPLQSNSKRIARRHLPGSGVATSPTPLLPPPPLGPCCRHRPPRPLPRNNSS